MENLICLEEYRNDKIIKVYEKFLNLISLGKSKLNTNLRLLYLYLENSNRKFTPKEVEDTLNSLKNLEFQIKRAEKGAKLLEDYINSQQINVGGK